MSYGVPRETHLYKSRVTGKFDVPSIGSALEGEKWLLYARVPVSSVHLDCRLEVVPIPGFVAARAAKRRIGSERSAHETLTASARGKAASATLFYQRIAAKASTLPAMLEA